MSKIILIGNPESGKTALLNCLLAKPFNSTYTKTTRTNHQKKIIDDVQYCISDTPSSEKFKGIKDADAVVICVDLSKDYSKEKHEELINMIQTTRKASAKESVKIFVVGTKTDLLDPESKESKIAQFQEQISKSQIGNITAATITVHAEKSQNDVESLFTKIAESIPPSPSADSRKDLTEAYKCRTSYFTSLGKWQVRFFRGSEQELIDYLAQRAKKHVYEPEGKSASVQVLNEYHTRNENP